MKDQKSESTITLSRSLIYAILIIIGIVIAIFLGTREPSSLISPDDDSPILYSNKIRKNGSKEDDLIYIDVRYRDLNGDADYIDWILVNSTTEDVFIYDSYLKDPKEKQINGSSFTGVLYCLGERDIVTIRVILNDKAGNESNPLEFELTCK